MCDGTEGIEMIMRVLRDGIGKHDGIIRSENVCEFVHTSYEGGSRHSLIDPVPLLFKALYNFI